MAKHWSGGAKAPSKAEFKKESAKFALSLQAEHRAVGVLLESIEGTDGFELALASLRRVHQQVADQVEVTKRAMVR